VYTQAGRNVYFFLSRCIHLNRIDSLIAEVDMEPALPAGAPAAPKLLDQVRARIRVKHYSIRTEDQYVLWIKRFILFHGKRHPRELGAEAVEAFLSDLAVNGRDTEPGPVGAGGAPSPKLYCISM
jgi:hypothetical protein